MDKIEPAFSDGLTVMDYVSFVLMFIACTAIGIYYGFFKGKVSVADYIVGNRNMNILPVALSMMASVFSSSLYVGKITEAYLYGIGALVTVLFTPISAALFICFYLPTFHELQLTTIYEYLHLRFGTSMRLQTSVMFIIQQIFISPVIIYVAAMCFNEVTGLDIYLISFITSVICVIYTCVGGLKAVIWTDVIQTIVMIIAVSWIAISGTINLGGFETVWGRSYNSSRLDLPRIDFDLSSRYSALGTTIGYPVMVLMSAAMNQGVVQRCLCLPTLKDAKWAIIVNFIGLNILFGVIAYSGFVIYATYYDCDPIASNVVKRKDQIVPFYVMNTLKSVMGIRGIFIAGIFSAALSTLSTSLNGLACVFLQDFYKPFIRKTASEKESKIFMMIATLVAGLIFMLLVFVVEKMGPVFHMTVSMISIVNGPLLSMFTVGMYMPSVRGKAALIGYWAGFVVVSWIYIGSFLEVSDGHTGSKPLYTFGCDSHNTSEIKPYLTKNSSSYFSIYKISFIWYTLVGFIVSILITCILNLFLRNNDSRDMDPKILSPLIRQRLTHISEEDAAVEMKLL